MNIESQEWREELKKAVWFEANGSTTYGLLRNFMSFPRYPAQYWLRQQRSGDRGDDSAQRGEKSERWRGIFFCLETKYNKYNETYHEISV